MQKKKKNNGAQSVGTEYKFGKDLDFATSEAYNLLRTNITFSVPDSEGGRVIGITSPCPQEGKSTTSLNLAYSLAEAGNKVILVDADMRRPSIAKIVGEPKSPGLSNKLADSECEAINKGLLHENLSILFSGDIPPNPSELIGSERMNRLMEQFRNEYDYVIVDLPPVISVSDPIAMSRHVDGVVVVVRHGHTRRRDVAEAMRQLSMVNAKVLGFVYNGSVKTKAHYGN